MCANRTSFVISKPLIDAIAAKRMPTSAVASSIFQLQTFLDTLSTDLLRETHQLRIAKIVAFSREKVLCRAHSFFHVKDE